MFDAEFQIRAAPKGLRASWSASRFIRGWEEFVRQCDVGYAGDLYEYEDELEVRTVLGHALGSEELRQVNGFADFEAGVRRVDDSFRRLLIDGPVVRPAAPWWRRQLPARAGEQLVEDAARLFGVTLRSDSGPNG